MAASMNITSARTVSQSPRAVKLQRSSVLPFAPSLQVSRTQQRVCFKVAAQSESRSEMAAKYGLDSTEGIFGFKPFGELWVGRAAMGGFAIGLGTEILTGQGILQQVGLSDGEPNGALFALIAAGLVIPTLLATSKTLVDLQTGDMTMRQFLRYAKFFGLDEEAAAKASRNLKKGDFTGPNDKSAIDAAREDMPADRVLGMKAEASVANDAAATMKSSGDMFERQTAESIESSADALRPGMNVLAEGQDLPQAVWLKEKPVYDESAYARDVELRNGRWAMVGFATAILIEAASGGGIIPQLIFYGKASGLLGAESGF